MSIYNYSLPNYSVPDTQPNSRPQNSWRNTFQSAARGPASPLHQSQGGTQPRPYPMYTVGSTNNDAGTSPDMLEIKFARLEKENFHLQNEIQRMRELDGLNKKKMEHVIDDRDDAKSTNDRLLMLLHQSEEQSKVLKEGKEELFLAVLNLNERIEMQNKTAAEAQTIWAKLPAAIKALKRLDDEAVKLRRDKVANDVEKDSLAKLIAKLQDSAAEALVELTLLRSKMESERVKMDNERNYLNSRTASLEETNASTSSCVASLVTKLEESKADNDRNKVSFHAERNALLDELERLRGQLATRSMILETMTLPHTDVLKVDIRGKESFLAFIDDLKHNLLRSEMKRKQLHNLLQEVRGNIRVFVRCRPFLGMDGDEQFGDYHDPLVSGGVRFFKDGTSVSLVAAPGARDKPQVFGFDHVFKCESTQDEVYKEVSDLVQSALDGYKVCIFSYGQTGSGKTHTMTGDIEGQMRGIIPRAVEQIISEVIEMRGNGWEIVVTMSMVEIYNEELRDLLEVHPSGGNPHPTDKRKEMKVSNLQGFVTIAGLTDVELDSQDSNTGMKQLEGLLDIASKSRMTACTAMNERSSRSHALFMLDITAKHCDGRTFLKGGLRLVDLAGSERLDRTGTLGDPARFKETVNINKSLSCLADVFVSLANKATHVPYRNSKLTMVLQDCLSNDGKALMFVNISPTHASSQETLCSLRFANQVSQVELGKATRNVQTISTPRGERGDHPQGSQMSSEKDNKSAVSEPYNKPDRNILINMVSTIQGSARGKKGAIRPISVRKSPKGNRSVPNRANASGPKRPSVSHIEVQEKKGGGGGGGGDYSETSSESSSSLQRN